MICGLTSLEMRLMIKGIIFDFDGLICDTETVELEIWHEVFNSHNYIFPQKQYIKTIGSTDTRNNIENLFHGLEIPEKEKITIQREMIEKYKDKVNQQPLQPGVTAFLKEAKKMDLKIGLASSSGRDFITHHLNRLIISHFFECTSTRDDVQSVKPDPELFLRTLDCLGLNPDEAIALEDSINGVEAAKRAGIYTIAIPNRVTQEFDFSNADFLINSLEKISLKTLISQIE